MSMDPAVLLLEFISGNNSQNWASRMWISGLYIKVKNWKLHKHVTVVNSFNGLGCVSDVEYYAFIKQDASVIKDVHEVSLSKKVTYKQCIYGMIPNS